MMNVENIYISKLDQFKSVIEAKASKYGGSTGVFQDLLSEVEQRLNFTSAEAPADSIRAAFENKIQTRIVTNGNEIGEINAIIESVAVSTGLDSNLIRAVIQTESSFRTNAVSGAGAQGLMQLMPGTAKELGVSDPFDAYQNIEGGSTYLKRQIERFGDVRLALAAYNTGPARIARLGIADADEPEEYSKISSRVRGYVDKVMTYYRQYSRENV